MLDERTMQALDMFALGSISEEDVCELLGRKEFFLTEEESTYVDCLQRDYDAWLKEYYNSLIAQMQIEEQTY